MKIENLKYFLSVVRTGSLHKTAEEYYLTPQNLSTIIRNIEQDAGVVLFDRTAKGMVLTAEGERFLPYAQTIASAYEAYFASKQSLSRIQPFYTTPALAGELTALQGSLLQEQTYLSIQKRSVSDLQAMLKKRMSGIYLIMQEKSKMERLNLNWGIEILSCDKNLMIGCGGTASAQNVKQEEPMVIVQDYYEGNYGDYLRMDDVAQVKALLRSGKAVYSCMEYHYRRNFQEEGQWQILKTNDIPAFQMILFFCGNYSELLQTEIEQSVKENFYAL